MNLDTLIDNFHKDGRPDLYDAIDYSFRSVMNDLAVLYPLGRCTAVLMLLAFYSIFYISILKGVTRKMPHINTGNIGRIFSGTDDAVCYLSELWRTKLRTKRSLPVLQRTIEISDGKTNFVSP